MVRDRVQDTPPRGKELTWTKPRATWLTHETKLLGFTTQVAFTASILPLGLKGEKNTHRTISTGTNLLNDTSAVTPQEKRKFFFPRNVTYASHEITIAVGIVT